MAIDPETMRSAWLATTLDLEQIQSRAGEIASHMVDVEDMIPRTGLKVTEELGSRYVVRYLAPNQLTKFLAGSAEPHWVTPTPYSSREAIDWLGLPFPKVKREYLLVLDLTKVQEVCGPAWIKLASGIEYYLPKGFPQDSIVDQRIVRVR